VRRTRSILSGRNLADLRRIARADVLLAFDFDGTLAPIAPTPARARMRAATRRRLRDLTHLYPCAVISGRALADVSEKIAGTDIRRVFGNHGLEVAGLRRRPDPVVRRWLGPLHDQLAHLQGIVVEDKRHSVSVHYRAAQNRRAALAAIERVVGGLPGVRAIIGEAAMNLLPRGRANKGVALAQALELSGCDAAIYVGDDQTDEDAFRVSGPFEVLGVRIGRSAASAARYHLESQAAIDRLLEELRRIRS
jgi:trehalose 6-phosphate phosphatase